jgi:hypothetical protein
LTELTTEEVKKRNCENTKRYYASLDKDRIAAIVARNEHKRQTNMYRICAYLSTRTCIDCGEGDVRVLEFDHVRGVKKASVSGLTSYTWHVIQEEIDKCEVVCSNCHKKRTHAQLNYRDYRPISGGEVWAS